MGRFNMKTNRCGNKRKEGGERFAEWGKRLGTINLSNRFGNPSPGKTMRRDSKGVVIKKSGETEQRRKTGKQYSTNCSPTMDR